MIFLSPSVFIMSPNKRCRETQSHTLAGSSVGYSGKFSWLMQVFASAPAWLITSSAASVESTEVVAVGKWSSSAVLRDITKFLARGRSLRTE